MMAENNERRKNITWTFFVCNSWWNSLFL